MWDKNFKILIQIMNSWTSRRWTNCPFEKFQNTIFKEILKNTFKRLLRLVQNLTIFFLFRISLKIQLLEPSKVLAKMGRGWQAGWVMAKIFLSNLHRHMMNKYWKFQEDTLIIVWIIAKWLKICCSQWPPKGY